MKSKGIIAIIIIIILGYFGISAWSDYTWDKRYLKSVGNNWSVFDKQNNVIDPILFYTIFKQPISRLGLIQLNSIKKINQGVYQYTVRWVDREFGGGGNSEDFTNFSDCNNNLEGYLKEGVNENNFSYSDIIWSACDENKYAKKENEKRLLREKFKTKCNIINDVMIGSHWR